ncbi:unnamed protein product [Fraxinus pennsylvanica]|uniref:RNA helicase n=1 Tax=Fraxinus pennsylvanica TaxID=56036 RepID=A0AAD1YV32_9LAMI|nr:unnamed protein product [Fraxinus pennsylvanica]
MHRIIQHVGRRSGAGLPEANGPTTRRADRQTLMVSATVPFSVIRAARSWGCDPLLVQAKNVIPLESVAPRASVNLLGSSSDSNLGTNLQTQAPMSLPPSLKRYYSVTRIQHEVDTLIKCVYAADAKCVIAFMTTPIN